MSSNLVLFDQLDYHFTISSPYSFIISLFSATVKRTSTPAGDSSLMFFCFYSPAVESLSSPGGTWWRLPCQRSHRLTRFGLVLPCLSSPEYCLSLLDTNFRRIHCIFRDVFHSLSFGRDLRLKKHLQIRKYPDTCGRGQIRNMVKYDN